MSTSSSSVHSEVSTTEADAQYQYESLEEDTSHCLVGLGVEEHQQDAANASGDEYDDDAFDDEPVALEDDYSTDGFENQDDNDEELRIGQGVMVADAIDEHQGSCEDEKVFASYGDESFEADADGDKATSVSQVRELQTGDQEVSPTTNEDLAVATQATKDLSKWTLSHRWYSDKIKMLSTGDAHRESGTQSSMTVAPLIPKYIWCALQQQLLHNTKQPAASVLRRDHRGRSLSRGSGSNLPSEFIGKMLSNAKTHRLLHTSFDRMITEASKATQTVSPHKRQLDTFCAVKRADLEGKLATIRFEDQWALSCTKHAFETNEMSIGTLELVQEMMAAQRSILRSPGSSKSAGDTLFSCMQIQAPNLDLTVESTKRCLAESRWLRAQAAKVLRSRAEPAR